jgi:hypothetical protein
MCILISNENSSPWKTGSYLTFQIYLCCYLACHWLKPALLQGRYVDVTRCIPGDPGRNLSAARGSFV